MLVQNFGKTGANKGSLLLKKGQTSAYYSIKDYLMGRNIYRF
jgi:hypothetical protein